MENSKIEWTNHTQNLWWGCTSVHAGCDHCYAEALSKRWGNDLWGIDKGRKQIGKWLSSLNKFQKGAKQEGVIKRVFVGSMMDIFEKPMPLINPVIGANQPETTGDLRELLYMYINLGYFPDLDFLLLTKRPSNINKMIPHVWKSENHYPKNVMFGTSPVDQATFDTLVNQLLQVRGRRFLSIEPQLGPIDLGNLEGIDWIIQGGESGHHRRPFNLDWAYSMRDQCNALGIPYFFKQIDKVKPIPEDLMVREFPSQPQYQPPTP